MAEQRNGLTPYEVRMLNRATGFPIWYERMVLDRQPKQPLWFWNEYVEPVRQMTSSAQQQR